MLLGSAPMSLLGVAVATWLKHRYGEGFEDDAGKILGGALILGGIGFALKTFVQGRPKSDAPFILARRDKVIAVLLGSIPGVLLGSQVNVKLPDRALRIALATTLTLSGVRLLEMPRNGIPARARARDGDHRAPRHRGAAVPPAARARTTLTSRKTVGRSAGRVPDSTA